jgi:hypothetical protein
MSLHGLLTWADFRLPNRILSSLPLLRTGRTAGQRRAKLAGRVTFRGSRLVRLACLALLFGSAACTTRDVQKELEIVEVRTGWYFLGTVAGQNKLVPSIAMKLKNVSQTPISGVRLNAVFRNVGEEQIIDQHFVPGIASNAGLEPGATTAQIVLRSEWGFTGTESHAQMLENSHFKDAEVTILGLHGRSNWLPMGKIPIERRLLVE